MGKTNWKELDALSEKEILKRAKSDPDAMPTTRAFWKNAKVQFPQGKQAISLRIDTDILEFFKKSGKGYQSRINAVLRSFAEVHK